MKLKSGIRVTHAVMITFALTSGFNSGHASEQDPVQPYCEGVYKHIMQMHEIYLDQILIRDVIKNDTAAAAFTDYSPGPTWMQENGPSVYRF